MFVFLPYLQQIYHAGRTEDCLYFKAHFDDGEVAFMDLAESTKAAAAFGYTISPIACPTLFHPTHPSSFTLFHCTPPKVLAQAASPTYNEI